MADIFGYTPNSWGRYPSRRRVASLSATRSSPSRFADPLSGSSSVARIFMSVDFPAPFGPSSPNIPGGISSEMPRKARTPPEYVFVRSRIESKVAVLSGGDIDSLYICQPGVATVTRAIYTRGTISETWTRTGQRDRTLSWTGRPPQSEYQTSPSKTDRQITDRVRRARTALLRGNLCRFGRSKPPSVIVGGRGGL